MVVNHISSAVIAGGVFHFLYKLAGMGIDSLIAFSCVSIPVEAK